MVEMIGDNWSGPKSGEWRVPDPDKAAVHAAIRALDGQVKTSLTVTFDDPYRQLTIAGGPTSFVVSGELADESIIDLINPDADPSAEPVELVCGGNRASFDPQQVVDVNQAIEAVDAFLTDFPDGLGSAWQVD
ncbi:hypothetical protein GCM10029992_36470 [Glycomyces albus]